MNPKISIITITFNSEKTLQRTIDSVCSQEYPELEYIIVDGASEDGTVDVINRNKDKITKWISEPDNGISDAFNKGISMATGELIGIINSDDMLAPQALKILAENYDESIDVYCGNQENLNEKTGRRYVGKPTLHPDFKGMNSICHPATFVSRKAYEKFGVFDVSCRYAMDCDLLMRFDRSGAKIIHIDETLAVFTMGGITFTKFTRDRLDEIIRVYRKNGASDSDIFRFRIIRLLKNILLRIFGRDRIAFLKNKYLKIKMGDNK